MPIPFIGSPTRSRLLGPYYSILFFYLLLSLFFATFPEISLTVGLHVLFVWNEVWEVSVMCSTGHHGGDYGKKEHRMEVGYSEERKKNTSDEDDERTEGLDAASIENSGTCSSRASSDEKLLKKMERITSVGEKSGKKYRTGRGAAEKDWQRVCLEERSTFNHGKVAERYQGR
jgi:hypothetical protein